VTGAPGRARPRLDPDRAAVAFVGDEAVILDLRDYRAFRANGSAALALRLMDGRRTSTAIARALTRAFAAPAAVVRGDLRRWLAELARRGLLARAARGGGAGS
jgi:hypothetical protein